MDTDYILHRILRRIASWAVYSFFTEVRVIGGENVPTNGPIIVYVFLSINLTRPGSYTTRMLYLGCLDLTLMARFRTATHHNMMLDPAILCSSSFLVAIALVDVRQLRRFLTIEYYTIGAKVGILLSIGDMLTGKCSQSLRESRTKQSSLQHWKYTCRSQKQRSPGPLPWYH